jgi:hypothetical protein
MVAHNEVDVLLLRKICHQCVGEPFLSAEIAQQGQRLKCFYCERIRKCYRLSALAVQIEAAFQDHYTRTPNEPNAWEYAMHADNEFDYDWVRAGAPVVYAIMNAADIPEAAARDVQEILKDKYWDYDAAAMSEETEFADDSYYEEKNPSDAVWQEEWLGFEQALKTQARDWIP